MKPKAIGVDIDGTLARRRTDGRGPFDWSRVGEDEVSGSVRFAVELFRKEGYQVILMSGRPEGQKPGGTEVREATEKWLVEHGIVWNHLHMRDAGDFITPDDVLKEGLYRERVEPFYDLEVILDDRNRVVDMWRGIGLQCWQVAPGDFG